MYVREVYPRVIHTTKEVRHPSTDE
ncbi:hypothetical protein ACA1_066560 [Acanthamoeba castellanii str. Neff]|uniref:Uncharacterized protein n=1 Tax=Acanthamoeba castellanii (strain ATCC 30010 / Neff) TaxID=1257118 RepID=L8GNJ9_ACACF|nr:hypothetical protein ACA1_066560 [Acanthamoeba castellanii str. Neff]